MTFVRQTNGKKDLNCTKGTPIITPSEYELCSTAIKENNKGKTMRLSCDFGWIILRHPNHHWPFMQHQQSEMINPLNIPNPNSSSVSARQQKILHFLCWLTCHLSFCRPQCRPVEQCPTSPCRHLHRPHSHPQPLKHGMKCTGSGCHNKV